MKRADVFVSVSHFEGHPNTVFEAAVVGCPLVLSEIPEHHEVLEGFRGAVRRSDVARGDLRRTLEADLRADPAAKHRTEAARARSRALGRVHGASYDEVYREVLERRRRRSRADVRHRRRRHGRIPVDFRSGVRMRDTMVHRGPDDSGALDPGGESGPRQRRLAIIDLSPGGHQPMADPRQERPSRSTARSTTTSSSRRNSRLGHAFRDEQRHGSSPGRVSANGESPFSSG